MACFHFQYLQWSELVCGWITAAQSGEAAPSAEFLLLLVFVLWELLIENSLIFPARQWCSRPYLWGSSLVLEKSPPGNHEQKASVCPVHARSTCGLVHSSFLCVYIKTKGAELMQPGGDFNCPHLLTTRVEKNSNTESISFEICVKMSNFVAEIHVFTAWFEFHS